MYRIIVPFAHLASEGYPAFWIERKDMQKVNIDRYDVIVMARLSALNEAISEQVITSMRLSGKCLVWETDDDLTNLPEWNPATKDVTPERIGAIDAMIRGCHAITTTNTHLAKRLKTLNDSVWVLPDCLDPDLYTNVHKTLDRPITIGLAGGNSHFEDWKLVFEPLKTIMQRYPQVSLVVAGYYPEYLSEIASEDRIVRLPWTGFDKYPQNLAQIDIGLCPLADHPFNYCKEPIKALEFGMAGAAVIASPVVYDRVVQHGQTGLLAYTAEDWVRHLARLIEKPKLRKELTGNLKKLCLEQRNIHKECERWWRIYNLIWRAFKLRPPDRQVILQTTPGFFAQMPQPLVS